MPDTTKASAYARIYAWFSAVANNDLDLLDDFLAHGVPIDAPHPLRHSTALMEATRQGRAGMVQWLLERGAAPAFLCGLPLGTALHCALRRRHWEVAQLLAARMSNCAVMDAHGSTPLHVLCAELLSPKDQPVAAALCSLFIAKQCPLNSLDHEGTTALHHCVINDHHELASLMLRHGANPNALIPDSRVSPLTIAALEKNSAIARLLLQYGADPHSRTREGSTPISIFPALAPLANQCRVKGEDTLHAATSFSAIH
jgi:ankyrin